MASIAHDSQVSTAIPPPRVFPLENGDRLTRAEFERRWKAMPQVKHAELVEGVVYMAAALRIDQHGEPHAFIMTWLGTYAFATAGVQMGDNASLQLDLDNEPQPDALLRIHRECGGQSEMTHDGYVSGAPELVAEVAASSTSIDLHAKLNVYRRHGVREYVVWRVLEDEIDWFVLNEGRFDPMSTDEGQVYKSRVFPGLWLDAPALIRRDGAAVLKTLQQGVATPEHAEFVARLTSARSH
jgi:Uma2 family endonuclease